MKNLLTICLSVLVFVACQQKAEKTPDTKSTTTDSSTLAKEQAKVDELAAFYSGTLPCPDCDAIETLLTLNADEKRTFTLEEQYKGKEAKTVESSGTWTLAGDIVSLNQKTSVSKYVVTAEGLVSLNADGSQKDAESAKKYLLRKVLGE